MLTRKSIQTLKISHFCILWISSKWFIFNIFVSSCCYPSSNFLLPIFLFFFFSFFSSSLSSSSSSSFFYLYSCPSVCTGVGSRTRSVLCIPGSVSVVPFPRLHIWGKEGPLCLSHPFLLSFFSHPRLSPFYSAFFSSSCFHFSYLLGYKPTFISRKFLVQRNFLAIVFLFWKDLVCKKKLPSEFRYLFHELFGAQSKFGRRKLMAIDWLII